MERTPLGKGRFLVTLSRAEIASINEGTKIAHDLGVKACNILYANRSSASEPASEKKDSRH